MKSLLHLRWLMLVALTTTLCSAQEIGLQLYSLRNEIPKDVPGTLNQIKNWGISEIEGGDTYGMSIEEFNTLSKNTGLKLIAIGADFAQLEKEPMAVAQRAKAFGVAYVVCYWIPHHGDNFTLADTENAIHVFNMAGKILAEQGISFCYHPHGYEFRPHEKGTLFDLMMAKLDPKYVNFEMDVFWIKHPGQDPVKILKKYKNRFPLMHLKDRKPGTEGNQNGHADVETNVVLGAGDVGIAAIMKAAKKYGVKHFFIEDESSRSVQQIPQSLEYLKSLK
ncbi:MAG: sugar phosphate isomerase/epimerase [Bacteroidetes bacterium CHB5]|nr:sugar phosphate isomerase/epimerase [Bacteroidetes bacterium CHB5]